jgi:uncharacterized protein (DUF2236 family)
VTLEIDTLRKNMSMGGDPYFDGSSMVRTVHREQVVSLAGARALLMQAAHPIAFAGFFAHSGALEEPYERLNRTAAVIREIVFGSRAGADAATRRVRAMHRRVRGTTRETVGNFPAGTAYAADDPELLLWILACLVDSCMWFYQRYVRTLSRDERDRYWQDYRIIGQLFGLAHADSPATIEDFDRYMKGMLKSGDLHVSASTRELAKRIVLRPPVPLAARPLLEVVNLHIVGSLPHQLRREYGLRWDPARELACRVGAEYSKRVLLPVLPRRLRYSTRRAWRPAAEAMPAGPSLASRSI